ncbi:alpha/beta fold hydrolase [Acinetobacter sp. XH1639]|uniref:esterase/lipase family protein n=1 Tax=Acinetobacter sp. XH1639 TaxID=3157368 RepID=UPI0032B49369
MSIINRFLLVLLCILSSNVSKADDSLGLSGLVNVDCHSSKHSPIILIHGTFANTKRAFSTMAPVLKKQGYCLYALNYGRQGQLSLNGTRDINQSVEELNKFIHSVLIKTGAQKVSLIGHSQGGLLAFLVARSPEMAGHIDRIVALAPSIRGTTRISGSFKSAYCPACTQQGAQSQFMRSLAEEKLNPQGIRSFILATRQDVVVVPVTRQFLNEPDVTNMLLQEKYPSIWASHSGLTHVPEAIELVVNFLK